LAEKIGGRGMRGGEFFAHADGLGALAGENECDFFVHVLVTRGAPVSVLACSQWTY
jgi:hypothetical protein